MKSEEFFYMYTDVSRLDGMKGLVSFVGIQG